MAALALWTLAKDSPESQAAVLHAGGLARLVGLTRQGARSGAARMAAGALGEFDAAQLSTDPRLWGERSDGVSHWAPIVDMLHEVVPEAEFGTESAANAALLMCKMLDAAVLTLQRDPRGPQAGAARKARDAIVAAVVARGRLQEPPSPRPFPSPLPWPAAYHFLVWTLRKLEVALRAVILARLRAAAAPSAAVDGATLRTLLEQADVVRVPARELMRERARLKSIERRERLGLESMETPDEFLCPITYEVMRDPVVASDGHSYERAAIEHYHAQEGRRTSPLTRAQLEVDGGRLRLFPNIALRKRIDDYEAEMESVAERAATLAEQRVRVELRPHGGDGEAPTPKVARRG